MNTRLLTSLIAGVMIFAGMNAEAKSPVVSALPDVQIGNMEDYDPTGAKMFVFTDAFNFDDRVIYQGGATSVADLKWSFAEEGTEQWYTINGIDPIAVGAAAIATAESNGTPKAPGASDIRAAGTAATFRDVVLSPVGGGTPTQAQLDEHAAGKIVRFYVSDGSAVVKQDVLVSAVDGGYDQLIERENSVDYHKIDTFENIKLSLITAGDAGTADWWYSLTTMNIGLTPMPAPVYNATLQAIQLRAGANNLSADKTKLGYLITTIEDNTANRMKWTDLGATAAEASENIVRAKFWIYAGGQSSTGMPASTIQIPNVRFKLQTGYMVANALEVFPGNINQFAASGTQTRPQDYNLVQQIAPSTDSTAPSAYRVDFKPFNAAYIYSNNLQANTEFGFMRAIELYQNMPFMNGSLYWTESWIGVYPASAVTPAAGTIALKTYSGTALQNFGTSAAYQTTQQNADCSYNNGATYYNATIYTNLGKDSSNPLGTTSTDLSRAKVTWSASGVALDARSFTPSAANGTVALLEANAAIIAKPSSQWTAADYASVARVARDKVYLVRYTADNSYVAATLMPGLQFRATIYYYWSQRFELNAAHTYGGTDPRDRYIQSCMPSTTAKTYDVILQSPMNYEIKANQSAWDAAPGYGVATVSDIRNFSVLGVSMIDTLSGNDTEKGYMNLSKIEIFEFDLVSD